MLGFSSCLALAGVRQPSRGRGRCAERQRERLGWLQVVASDAPVEGGPELGGSALYFRR